MTKIIKTFLIINFLICSINAFSFKNSQRISKDTSNLNISIKDTNKFELKADNTILIMLDSLSKLKYFEKISQSISTENKNIYNFSEDYVPDYPDSIYDMRIKKLNANSAFKLIYNKEVRDYIGVYAFRKRKLTSRILGMTKMYFTYFEEKLDKYNMPMELKYLAVVEEPNPSSLCF